ncbi:MAG TPA: hypothetical protein DCS09_08870 [Porphyromonadaceae bacterium]|nr:hypothetical protein [Porphyromonadaceae bacterium]
MVNKALGNALRMARVRAGKSQEYYAEKLGVGQQAISRYETTGEIPPERHADVAQWYGIDPATYEIEAANDVMVLGGNVSQGDKALIKKLLMFGNRALKEELLRRLQDIEKASK